MGASRGPGVRSAEIVIDPDDELLLVVGPVGPGPARALCTRCGEYKPIDAFAHSRARRLGVRAHCHVCEREQATAYSRKNPGPYRDRAHAQRIVVRRYLNAFLDEVRVSRGCAFCHTHEGCTLDFHHAEKGKNPFRISQYTMLERELRKCLVVCASCHRRVHAGLLQPTDGMRCDVSIPRVPVAELRVKYA